MSNGNGHSWSKFFWRDWSAEISLRTCSLAARGYWMEMLCVMHEGVPIGHLTFNERPVTPRQMAAWAGCTEREAKKYEAELDAAGVFSRTEAGVIYCRRMVKEANASAAGASEVRKKWGEGELSGTTRARRLTEARKKGTHTPEQWHAMVDVLGDRCLRCEQVAGDNGHGLVKDHIVPIYQGGSDGIENIQPMCRSCNAAKGPETTDYRPPDWQKRLGERLGECLGADQKTPRSAPRVTPTKNLEAEAELEAEEDSKKDLNFLEVVGYSAREAASEAPEREPTPAEVEAKRRKALREMGEARPLAEGMAKRFENNYPPRAPKRTVNEQREAVVPPAALRPKPSYFTREQINAALRKTA